MGVQLAMMVWRTWTREHSLGGPALECKTSDHRKQKNISTPLTPRTIAYVGSDLSIFCIRAALGRCLGIGAKGITRPPPYRGLPVSACVLESTEV